MTFHVQREVIGARELAVTLGALKWLVAGVFAHVTRQFVGASETPLAALPVALVRLFPCKRHK